MKTMSAFANHFGGYLFFGIEDSGRAVSFNAERFKEYDWDAFDKILEAHFTPYVRWNRTIVDVPQHPEFRFDAELIKRQAKLRGVSADHYEWILEPDIGNLRTQVGVIYAYRSDLPVACSKAVSGILKAGVCYVRRMGRNGQFEEQPAKLSEVQLRAPVADHRATKLAEFEAASAQAPTNHRPTQNNTRSSNYPKSSAASASATDASTS
jgi:Putative DNA-binding domain